jgi:predicted  nucleic acid-binding Zn-ribbon protein
VPDPLVLLLDVQAHDLTADQLRHKRASLPERAAMAEQERAIAGVDAELAEVGGRLHELERAQKKLEDEVASVEAKAKAENDKLYSGSVTSPRELQAMQEEIDGLGRRQRELEDEELELMERSEPLTAEVEGLEARKAGFRAEVDRLAGLVAEAEGDLDQQLAAVEADRATVAAGIGADLLATYDKLRDRLGGVAVAKLVGTQCTGCHLSLPATEMDAVRRAAPGAVVYHEECGRILVP